MAFCPTQGGKFNRGVVNPYNLTSRVFAPLFWGGRDNGRGYILQDFLRLTAKKVVCLLTNVEEWLNWMKIFGRLE